MKNIQKIIAGLFLIFSVFLLNQLTNAQTQVQRYTGNIISFNGPRAETTNFTLRINKETSDDQAKENLSILQVDGQDKLLSTIRKEDVGTLSIGNGLARTVNVVRESQIDGKERIFVVFERWMRFGELRGGYRSVDYPFGVIEMTVDERTGKGEGTYIAAAQIRWKKDKKSGQYQVEVENFATYPAKLMGVSRRGGKS